MPQQRRCTWYRSQRLPSVAGQAAGDCCSAACGAQPQAAPGAPAAAAAAAQCPLPGGKACSLPCAASVAIVLACAPHTLPSRLAAAVRAVPCICRRHPHTHAPPAYFHSSCPLQMFARELHSGWTSWGNEVLKFQSASCFEAAQHAPVSLAAPAQAAPAQAAAASSWRVASFSHM